MKTDGRGRPRGYDVHAVRPGARDLPVRATHGTMTHVPPGNSRTRIECTRGKSDGTDFTTRIPRQDRRRSNSLCHVTNICLRLGRKLRWDPQTETFPNDPEANRLLARAMRSPWQI